MSYIAEYLESNLNFPSQVNSTAIICSLTENFQMPYGYLSLVTNYCQTTENERVEPNSCKLSTSGSHFAPVG